ncbi:MAG: hypothetical protein KJ052_07690, partial [Candidatus Hydrogenedentes bacterium]|nr:hypothetical protein [Candidatus Hydrogenedentota bacterium]
MIQQRLYYEKLQTALKEAAALIVRDATHLPSNSLIGRLRVPLRKGVAGLTTFRDWLSESDEEHVHEKPLRAPARDQLEKCHLDWDGRKVELMAWLRAF